MSIFFKAWKSNIPNEKGERLWYPKAVVQVTVGTREIADDIAAKSSLSRGDVINVVDHLMEEMQSILKSGRSVKLDKLGIFKPAIKSGGNGVETPEKVSASQVNSMCINFVPTGTRTQMDGVTRAMYTGVQFERWKGDPYYPKNKQTGDSEGEGEAEGGAPN